jgi:mono/diheme cytochrome c family protein
MRQTRLLGSLVMGGIVGLAVAVYAAETKPSETYDKYCAKCHGDDGKAKTMRGKSMKARDFTDAEWQAGETDDALIAAVTDGKDEMPAFGKKLTAEQIESLVKVDVRGFAPKKE